MNTPVTEMKLVPIDVYREWSTQASNDTPSTEVSRPSLTPSRSIASIRENLGAGNRGDSGVNTATAATAAVAGLTEAKLGGARQPQDQPIWTHNDPTTLPEFSQNTSILKAHQEFVNTLNRTDLPEHLHRALIQITRANYLKAMKYNSHDDDDNEGDDDDDDYLGFKTSVKGSDYRYNASRGIENVLSRTSNIKKKIAKRILETLSRHSAHIRWDRFGNIMKPVNVKYIRNLDDLLNVMMYKDRSNSANSIKEASNLLSPFYNVNIQNMIKNTKLLDTFETKKPLLHGTPTTSSSSKNTYRRLTFST